MLDFDKLLEAEGKAALKGCDVGFCALGTTRGKSGVVGLCVCCWDMCVRIQSIYLAKSPNTHINGQAGFIKVDHDYVVNAAKAGKARVCSLIDWLNSQSSRIQ